MISPSDYVDIYLRFYAKFGATIAPVRVRNYLKYATGHQYQRAQAEFTKLKAALVKRLKLKAGLPDVFEIEGKKYLQASLKRVYEGKGAPDEIQSALWLASLCNLVSASTKDNYTDQNLGMDCSGFVANYWGKGRPSPTNLKPDGLYGFLPRTLWASNKNMQRDHPSQIRIGDAAVFFQDVKGNDPDRRAKLKADHKTYDTSTGSQAHHIALVSDVWWSTSDDKIELEIAESSGTISQSGGNGVHVRSLGDVQSYVSNKLVYCRAGNDRIYFVASAVRNPYLPDTLEDTAMPEDVLG